METLSKFLSQKNIVTGKVPEVVTDYFFLLLWYYPRLNDIGIDFFFPSKECHLVALWSRFTKIN